MILAAITVLYLINVIQGVMQWANIYLLIGTNEQTIAEDLVAEVAGSFAGNPVLQDITNNLPVIIADGLLVRDLV